MEDSMVKKDQSQSLELKNLSDPNNTKNSKSDGSAISYSSEKMSALRSLIDSKLHDQGVYGQIQSLIEEKLVTLQDENTNLNNKEHIEEEAIRIVLESDAIQQLIASIRDETLEKQHTQALFGQTYTDSKFKEQVEQEEQIEDLTKDPENGYFLYLRLVEGRAFIDQLISQDAMDHHTSRNPTDQEEYSGPEIGDVQNFFRLNLVFQNQRLVSKDVRCCVDPAFDEHFRFRIDKARVRTGHTKGGSTYEVEVVSPWESLCLMDEPVDIILTKVTKKLVSMSGNNLQWHDLSKELLATHRLDWRRVLCSTVTLVHFPIQLIGKLKVPVGTLDFRADLLHFKRTSSIAREVSSFLTKESLQQNSLNHSFYQYAKQWWEDYKVEVNTMYSKNKDQTEENKSYTPVTSGYGHSNHTTHHRLVKMFAEDEDGRFRFVCKYVTTIRDPRTIRSPSEAARFVSLIPYETHGLVGGGKDETWRSMASFLSLGKGDCQEHAILLASLLLGCGLDAYVCIGTIQSGRNRKLDRLSPTHKSPRHGGSNSSLLDGPAAEIGHVWVMTRGSNTHDAEEILFWESLTGERYKLSERGLRHGYMSIDCVFNSKSFYANRQPKQWHLWETSFDLEDDTKWKTMNSSLIGQLSNRQATIGLVVPNWTNQEFFASQWARQLKKEITSKRRVKGLYTTWNRELSFYLLTALNSYEMERLYGISQIDNSFFQESIKRFVPDGHTFKGFPCMFTSQDTCSEALEVLARQELPRSILNLHAPNSQFALAVRCFAYPENICVIWIMLAVSYQTITQ